MDGEVEGERLKLTVSLIDLLNYVVPGATLLGLVLLFAVLAPPGHRGSRGFDYFWAAISPSITGDGWLVPVVIGFGVLLAAYVIGHVIDSFAGLLIDRTLVYKGLGYPYQNLLTCAPLTESDDDNSLGEARRWKKYSGEFHRGSFVLLNACLVVGWLAVALYYKQHSLATGIAVVCLIGLAALFVLQCILKVACSSVRARRPSRTQLYLSRSERGRAVYRLSRRMAHATEWPFRMAGRLITPVLSTRLSFNKEFTDKYKAHFERLFGLNPDTAESNNYWMCYCYLADTSAPLFMAVRRWETLYLFSRNLAASLFIFSQFVLALVVRRADPSTWGDPATGTWLAIAFGIYLLSVLLLIHFYYLYVSYFSKLLYRSFVYLAEKKLPLGVRRGY